MMLSQGGPVKVFVATRPVDFRKGIDGLALAVQEMFGLDPFCGAVFVFRSKRADRTKLVENVWQFMRENWLSNRVFRSYDDIVALCCDAWNKLIDRPWKIMSIGMRKWAHG